MTMKAGDLRTSELAYEIAVRGVTVPVSVDERRKVFRGLLAQENASRSFLAFSNPFQFSVDLTEVTESLASLTSCIETFKGVVGDAEYKRINSRLTHLSGRISRMNPVGDEQVAARDKSRQDLLILESNFEEKCLGQFDDPPVTHPDPVVPADPQRDFGTINPASAPTHPVMTNPLTVPASQIQHHSESFRPTASTPNIDNNPFCKKVPVFKWGIPKFSGRGSLVSFLELVESLMISRGCTKEDLFASAGDLFESHAWTWWHNAQINSRFSTWDELVEGLKQTFLRENYDRALWDEIRSRRQAFREPVLLFISSMEALFYRLTNRPSQREMVETIKINLLPDYIKLLALHNIQSVQDLTVLCKRIDDSLQLCKPPASTPQNIPSFPRPPRINTVSNIICWSCRKPGHHYTSCYQRGSIFCHSCGNPGVSFNSCNKCSKNEQPTGNIQRDAVSGSAPKASTSRMFHRNANPRK